MQEFFWTNSYFVSTSGGAPLAKIKNYIQNQKRSEKRCAGMGGLQRTTINCGKQNIKQEKSPLSTPGDVPSPKERAPRE